MNIEQGRNRGKANKVVKEEKEEASEMKTGTVICYDSKRDRKELEDEKNIMLYKEC